MERAMEKVKEGIDLSKRSFLNISLFASFFAMAVATIYPIIRYLWPPKDQSSGNGQALNIPMAELPVGKAKMIRYQGSPAVVIRTGSGVFALSAICTHLGCIVKWEEDNKRLFCPCHAAIFDVNGNVLGGPAPRPLPSYPVKIAGEQVIVGGA